MVVRWRLEDLNERQRGLIDNALNITKRRKSKYNVCPAQQRTCNNIIFDSQKEMEYYKKLVLLQEAGKLKFFLRQVPFDLPGGVKYRVDFVEFYPSGVVRFVDVKGLRTKEYILKKKQVEALYPIKIEEE